MSAEVISRRLSAYGNDMGREEEKVKVKWKEGGREMRRTRSDLL